VIPTPAADRAETMTDPPTEPRTASEWIAARVPDTESDVTDMLPIALSTQPFAAELSAQVAKTELEAEVRQLRAELTALRAEMAEIKTTRRTSPLYAEAAALAQRGFDARGVAEECGISVAEAELVLAMSRDSKDFEIEVDDGAGTR